jgi:hypothetical protein
MPDNAVYVGRPTKWGNPFKVGSVIKVDHGGAHLDVRTIKTLDEAVAEYEFCMFMMQNWPTLEEVRNELRGKNLVCWCPLHQKCHADVLLKIANK